jgi:hypothetical protein
MLVKKEGVPDHYTYKDIEQAKEQCDRMDNCGGFVFGKGDGNYTLRYAQKPDPYSWGTNYTGYKKSTKINPDDPACTPETNSSCEIVYDKKIHRSYTKLLKRNDQQGVTPDNLYYYWNLDDAKAKCNSLENCGSIVEERIANNEYIYSLRDKDSDYDYIIGINSYTKVNNCDSNTNTVTPVDQATPTNTWPADYPFQPLVDQGVPQTLGSNSAPPPGYQRTSTAGDCKCRRSGFGLDSCGDTCCEFSPFTSEDPNGLYGVNHAIRSGRNWGRCFERIPPDSDSGSNTPKPVAEFTCKEVYGTNIPLYTRESCNQILNGQFRPSESGDTQYGECLDENNNSISWQNRNKCSSIISSESAKLKQDYVDGKYQLIADFHDNNHIGTPVQNAWSERIEGFTNNSIFTRYKDPNNAIYKKNLEDKNVTKEMQERLFNQSNIYNNELKDMYSQADTFSKTNAGNNPNKGTNVQLSSGTKGYVTERGIFKWYPNNVVINATQGKNGCGSGMSYTNLGVDGNYKLTGSIIESSPPMLVGTPMKPGQACGNSGTNVQITQKVNPSLVGDTYLGCYKNNPDFSEETDLGITTREACKTRALDLGKTLFALTNKKEDKGRCWTSSSESYKTKKEDGVIDQFLKDNQGQSFIASTDMFSGKINNTRDVGLGLLKDGTLAMGFVPQGSPIAGDVFGLTNNGTLGHYLINGAPPITNCNKYIGGSVNIPAGADSSLLWNNNQCQQLVSKIIN